MLDQKVLEMVNGGEPDPAYAAYVGNMRGDYNGWRDSLVKTIDNEVRQATEAAQGGEEAFVSAQFWIYGAVLLAAALCGLAGFLIVAGVSRPVVRMTDIMRRLAGHDLKVEIEGVGRKDEIGAMAAAVQVFKDSIIKAPMSWRIASAPRNG